jgi:hypothetical protein
MINNTEALLGYLAEAATNHVVGADPFAIEALVQPMWRGDYARPGQIEMSGIAAIELACWDIVGKALGVPVYRCLLLWAAREAERSSPFRAEVDELRELAREPHERSTGPLVRYSFAALEQLEAEGERPQRDRPRAWKNTPEETADGNRHVRAYLQRCRRVAGARVGSKAYADLLHELVRRDHGYAVIDSSANTASSPAGAAASAAAAHISGASWGSGMIANRQTYYRVRDRLRTTFTFSQSV